MRAWQEEGAAGLRATLERMDEMFPKGHFLLDADARDVLTGEDRSALRARSQRWFNGVSTRDGGYTLVFAMPPPPPPPLWLWPYLVLVAFLIAVMCWVFTLHLVNPVRHLRATVREFGAGHLTLRTESKRHDELGDLARDFDLMADRIETLLTSERRLLQDVSHELRTPLARLVLAVELMRPDEAKQEVARLSSLIGELVDMTRAEGGLMKVDREIVDLSALLEETAARHKVTLAADAAPGLSRTCGLTSTRLGQCAGECRALFAGRKSAYAVCDVQRGLRGDLRSRLWTWCSGRGTHRYVSSVLSLSARMMHMEWD